MPESDLGGEGSSQAAAEAPPREAARRQRLRAARTATAVIAAVTAAIIIPLTLLPGASAADRQHQRSTRALAGPSSGHATIAIDPQTGLTFAPAPASAVPEVTAGQAWARFARLNRWSRTGIPSGVQVRLGFLTAPVGPNGPGGAETYLARNELAYGYSSPSGCVTMNPRLKPPPDAHCIFWTFLNANTGAQIESTYQKIGHWHWLSNPEGP